MKVQVLSAPMSYGKSESAIKTICSEPDNFYFVVLPYLKEVTRYKECNEYLPKDNSLIEPCDIETSKSKDLLNILQKRLGSVVTTHAMFESLTESHINTIKKLPMKRGEKVLVLDETIDLVRPVSSSRLPFSALQADVENEYIVVNETTGRVQWNYCKDFNDGAYPHHEYLKNLCETGMLYFLEGRYLVMELSINFLECFDRILVMTYRWSSSIMANYLTVNNIQWEMLDLDEKRVLEVYEYIANHLEIPNDYSIDDVSMSGNGFRENLPTLKTEINKNIKQAMKDYDVDLSNTLYTTFKTVAGEDMRKWLNTLSIGSYQKKDTDGKTTVPVNFLSHTTLGTNEYSHCKLMVYGLSKHIMPGVQSYFAQRESSFPSADWELSSLLQWLFRGCIRDQSSGETMVAVILCPRMRQMAQEWLAGIKRQVATGQIDKPSNKVVQLDAKKRRTKMQQFKQWKAKNPGGECFSFNDYLEHGGPALKRQLKAMA